MTDEEYARSPSFILELLSSMKQVDCRIDEALNVVKNHLLKDEEVELQYKKRIHSLVKTRMCIAFSLLDLGITLNEEKVSYNSMRRSLII